MKRLLILATAIAAGLLAKKLLEREPPRKARPWPRLRDAPTDAEPFGYTTTVASNDEALGVMAVFDQHQIACAELALERDLDDATTVMAGRVRKEHTDQLDETRARLEERSAEPMQYESVAQFETRCLARQAVLAALDDDGFAALYLERVADEHAAIIDLIDRSLLPAASDSTVRELLRRHRAHAAAHRAEAQLLH